MPDCEAIKPFTQDLAAALAETIMRNSALGSGT